MKLLDSVEDSVQVNGMSYRCDTTVPAVLLYFELMEDDGLTDYEKVEIAYNLLVKSESQIDTDITTKIDVIKAIYETKISNGQSSGLSDQTRNYDFDQDDDLIYSSILQQYKINIRDSTILSNLRWHDFISLFTNLGSKTPFGQAVFFRGVKITDDMPDERKEYYRSMKRKYALKKNDKHISFSEMDLPHKIAYLAKQKANQKEG